MKNVMMEIEILWMVVIAFVNLEQFGHLATGNQDINLDTQANLMWQWCS